MTLRFFRKKPASSEIEEVAPERLPKASEPATPSARSPRPAAKPSRPAAGRTVAARSKPAESAPATKPPGTRTRRGRRGGAGRKKPDQVTAAPASQAKTAAAEPAPVVEIRPKPRPEPVEVQTHPDGSLEGLLERQLSFFKSFEKSLSGIESRLSGLERFDAQSIERPRLGIFVDVPNIIYAAERQRVKLDFKKVLEFLVRGRELVRASAYAPISDDPQAKLETQRFVQPFADLGYRIVTKPYKRYADGSMKANFDVELAMDVLTMSDRLDIVTLVSGDGDFRRMVELVESKGVRVEVVAFGPSTAAELRAVADEYTDFNAHLAELQVK